jgi:uncharacterized repeat protein (TIGR01451 family)
VAATPSAAFVYTVLSNADNGPGTLRDAITSANGSPGLDVIQFFINGGGQQTISLQSALPEITDAVLIDGWTQPGWAVGKPIVEIRGDGGGCCFGGLDVHTGGATIRGLVLNSFDHIPIELRDDGCANVVQGNFINTDVSGTIALGGQAGAIGIEGCFNMIGGASPELRNVMVGGVGMEGTTAYLNTVQGNYIGTDVTGTVLLGGGGGVATTNGRDAKIGGLGPGERNVIAGGVAAIGAAATNVVIAGNMIGTDVTGSFGLGFGCVGISAPGTQVIGNVINGCNGGGVQVFVGHLGAVIQDNRIGTDANGTKAIGNFGDGINLQDGEALITGNVISGNGFGGIFLTGDDNIVKSNFIGTNADGSAIIGNGSYAIRAEQGTGTIIGAPDEGNVIGGNGGGIFLDFTDHFTIQGNIIGANATLDGTLPNGFGIDLRASSDTLIGGTEFGAGNVIAGNVGDGISLEFAEANHNTIEGNWIGTDRSGTQPLGNGQVGILLGSNCPSDNLVGGYGGGSANVIAFNGEPGVAVFCGTGNAILGNAIYSNGPNVGGNGLGIDLEPVGPTPNDAGDGDLGANNLQNFPLVSVASPASGGGTELRGSLRSTPDTLFRLEFFANNSCDPSGFGEGGRFLGSKDVITNPTGSTSFATHFVIENLIGQYVTATATDPGGNTSEFSECRVVAPTAELSLAMTDTPDPVKKGKTITYLINAMNDGPFDASNLQIFNPIPGGTKFVSVSPSAGGTCIGGPVGICTWAGLTPPGTTRTMLLVVKVTGGSPSISNTANVTSPVLDPNTSNNQATALTTVQ